jgi:tetratricopeptide (TPR) repeat protein
LIDGNVASARDHYRNSLDEIDALAAADPHNEFILSQQVMSGLEFGHALLEVGRVDEGVKHMREAVERLRALPQTASPLVRSLEIVVRGWLGEGLEKQHALREAQNQYEAGKESLNAVRANGASPRIVEYYAMTSDRLGSVLIALGDVDRGASEFDEAQRLLEPLVTSDPDDYEIAYALADTYTRQGLVAAARAAAAADREHKLSQWRTARERFERSLAVWKGIPNPARMSTSGFEVTTPERVRTRLAESERVIAALAR